MKAFYTSFLLLFTLLAYGQSDWTILQREASVLLRDVDFNGDAGFAVGGDKAGGQPLSVLLRSTDNGSTWEELAVPFNTSVRTTALDFVSADRGWIVGEDGTIFYTEDGGLSWGNQISNTDRHLTDVFFVNDNVGYITGEGNSHLVLKTTDGGLSWTDLSFGDSSNETNTIFFLDENTGWIGGTNTSVQPYIYRTDDGGLTWTEQDLPAVIADQTAAITGVVFADENVGYACVNSLYVQVPVLKTTDGGTTWDVIFTSERDYHHIALRDAQSIAVVATSVLGSGADKLYVSTDGGVNFSTYNQPVKNYAGGAVYRGDEIVVVSDQSIVMRSPANGAALEVINESPRLNAIAWQDALNGWITSGYVSGTAPFSLRTTDGGNTWTDAPGAPGGTAIDFLDTDPDRGWILFPGQLAKLWRTTNGGDSWLVKQVGNGGSFLEDFFFVDANVGWVFGGNGSIRKTTDGGVNFSFQNLDNTGVFVQALQFIDANEGWCAGGFGSGSAFINHSTDGGETWTAQTPVYNEQILDLQFLDAQNGFACTVGGHTQRTSDGGLTWKPGGDVPHLFAESIHMTSPAEGYLVARDKTGAQQTGQGHIYTTEDGGDTWALAFSNDYIEGSFSGFALNPDGNPWAVGNHNTIAYRGELVSSTATPARRGIRVSAYPNPVTEQATFAFTLPTPAPVSLSIFSADGRLVHREATRRAEGEQRWTWTPGPLAAGTYTYVLQVAGVPTAGVLVR